MSQSAEDRVSPGAADTLRAAIREASGQEVFFLGRIDDTGKLVGLSVAARGNESSPSTRCGKSQRHGIDFSVPSRFHVNAW